MSQNSHIKVEIYRNGLTRNGVDVYTFVFLNDRLFFKPKSSNGLKTEKQENKYAFKTIKHES